MTVAVPVGLPSKTIPLLTSRPPATTALCPFRLIPEKPLPPGVPIKVRLPPLKNRLEPPVLTRNVAPAAVGPLGMFKRPNDWKLAALTVLPAPMVTVPLPWLVNPLNVTGPVSPGATFNVPPLVKLMNWSAGLFEATVTDGWLVTLANWPPVTG